MDDKIFRNQSGDDNPPSSYRPSTKRKNNPNKLMWQFAGGIVIASLIIGVGNALYKEYQARQIVRVLEKMAEDMERQNQHLLNSRGFNRPAETWQEREIRGEKAQQAYKTSQRNLERCQFWMMQEPSERQSQEMAKYCR